MSSGGSGADAWYVFEPAAAAAARAPLAIVMHGYYEFSGYDQMYELIRHTVRKGNVVIYPRWQTGVATPCPGPFDIEPCMTSAVNGIRGALAYLRASRAGCSRELERTSYFGFSFGGIITANLANRYGRCTCRGRGRSSSTTRTTAASTAPTSRRSTTRWRGSRRRCCSSATRAPTASSPSRTRRTASCNAIFPKLGAHPGDGTRTSCSPTPTTHGAAGALLAATACAPAPKGTADAYDWNFCWKVWDALRSCAYAGSGLPLRAGRHAASTAPTARWSDGMPITPLKIQDAAPIGP